MEERISRVKHDSGFPKLAIDWVLQEGGLSIHDVDYVVFYEKPFVKFDRMLMTAMATFPPCWPGKVIPRSGSAATWRGSFASKGSASRPFR